MLDPTPTCRSHVTQVLQNYFDPEDRRTRRSPVALDSQLLNLAAQQIDQTDLRVGREIKAATLRHCPVNIDNGGVYWKQGLPRDFNYSLSSHVITGSRAGSALTLNPYNDFLPVPTRVTLDSTAASVSLASSCLFRTEGIGDPLVQSWATQRFGPFTPSFVSRVQFWLDGPGYSAVSVLVRITGQKAPAPAWADASRTSSETLHVFGLGWVSSKFAWSRIDQIQVTGLPTGVTLAAFNGSFELPMQPDTIRPFSHPDFRDVEFDRYWASSGGLLTEQYLESDYSGWRRAHSYAGLNLTSLAVEPNTWGLFGAAGTTLYYFDRREPLPGNLDQAALTAEPYYGLEIEEDETVSGSIRYLVLTPIAYASAEQASAYRFTVSTPDGANYAVTPDGLFAPLTDAAGWRRGQPPTIRIPLATSGNYIFSLQGNGPSGILSDVVPWLNAAVNPLATLDLSGIVSSIAGLSFDDNGRLWVWDGNSAHPLSLHYNAYLIDQGTQALYLTDSVDSLMVDGVSL